MSRDREPKIKIGKTLDNAEKTFPNEKDKALSEGFFHLIDDNFKREEIFNGFQKLRKIEQASLNGLNGYFLQLERIRNYLSLLSLNDWLKLGEYAEFLNFGKGFDKGIVNIKQEIKLEVEKVKLEEILKNPKAKEFDDWETARHIKQLKWRHLRRQGRAINPAEIEKQFNKEKENKINSGVNSAIREYLLNSPKENVKDYLKTLGIEGEVNEDIIFAARLHRVLEKKGETKNKEVLEKLMRGKKPIDFEENKKWLEGMEGKINTKKWLVHKKKDYDPIREKNLAASLEKGRKKQLNEIVNLFKNIKIEIKPEINEIEKILHEKQREIPQNIIQDIKTHLRAYYSLFGIEKSPLPKKIILETEENPLKSIQVGEKVTGSCLEIRGGKEGSAVCNAAGINKKIVWVKDEKENILGRILLAINEEGKLERFWGFNNDHRLNLEPLYDDFIAEFTNELGTTVGFQGKIKELVGENWYDDRARVPLGLS